MAALTDASLVRQCSGTFLERWLSGAVSWLQMQVLRAHKAPHVLNVIRQIWADRRGAPLPNEAFLLHSLAFAQQQLPGAYAEVGVFRGSTARMICEGKGNKPFYLFDTFAGLFELSEDVPKRRVCARRIPRFAARSS
jgi:hypothetical protein